MKNVKDLNKVSTSNINQSLLNINLKFQRTDFIYITTTDELSAAFLI